MLEAIRIRVDVFILEQHCPPGWEPDELDKDAIHYVAQAGKRIVATARMRVDEKNVAKIERIAVKKAYRGKKIGKGLLQFILQDIRKHKYDQVQIQAQSYAKQFYIGLGFKVTSEEYDPHHLGIPHVDMKLIL